MALCGIQQGTIIAQFILEPRLKLNPAYAFREERLPSRVCGAQGNGQIGLAWVNSRYEALACKMRSLRLGIAMQRLLEPDVSLGSAFAVELG